MKIDEMSKKHIELAFSPLRRISASDAFPAIRALADKLNSHAPPATTGVAHVNVTPAVASLFATASVDMWLRAVHSFLVSVSLTDVSHIWASVAGYYSSHYSVRALAHLFGYFQLHHRKKIVKLELIGGTHVEYQNKNRTHREHKIYWKIVKDHKLFQGDPLFTSNSSGGTTPADVDHRDTASYADHLAQFTTFRPLDEQALKNRIRRISGIEFSTPPIPDAARYPDVESVQIVAYHRLVRFRDLVDDVLGGKNRFWTVHRSPSWASGFVDYQLTEQATLSSRWS
jgi:hypothetical protein